MKIRSIIVRQRSVARTSEEDRVHACRRSSTRFQWGIGEKHAGVRWCVDVCKNRGVAVGLCLVANSCIKVRCEILNVHMYIKIKRR